MCSRLAEQRLCHPPAHRGSRAGGAGSADRAEARRGRARRTVCRSATAVFQRENARELRARWRPGRRGRHPPGDAAAPSRDDRRHLRARGRNHS